MKKEKNNKNRDLLTSRCENSLAAPVLERLFAAYEFHRSGRYKDNTPTSLRDNRDAAVFLGTIATEIIVHGQLPLAASGLRGLIKEVEAMKKDFEQQIVLIIKRQFSENERYGLIENYARLVYVSRHNLPQVSGRLQSKLARQIAEQVEAQVKGAKKKRMWYRLLQNYFNPSNDMYKWLQLKAKDAPRIVLDNDVIEEYHLIKRI